MCKFNIRCSELTKCVLNNVPNLSQDLGEQKQASDLSRQQLEQELSNAKQSVLGKEQEMELLQKQILVSTTGFFHCLDLATISNFVNVLICTIKHLQNFGNIHVQDM